MKQGWKYMKLGSASTFMSGYTPNKDEIQETGQYPYFKVAEMNKLGNEIFMVNTSLFVNHPKKVFPKGSIIFPKNGGAIYTEKKRILKFDSVVDLNTEALFPNDQVNTFYLFYFLNHLRIAKFDKGGGLPSLDLKRMADDLIPVPPLPEQERIVERLDAAFAQIDELKSNAEKQFAEAHALFQASLNEMLEPKERWEVFKLCEVVNIINGYAFPSKAFGDNQELKVVKITNVGVGSFLEDSSTLPQDMFIQEVCVKEDDIVIALTRTIISEGLKRAKVPYTYNGAMLNQRVASLRYNGKINMSFLYYYLGSPFVSDYVWSHVNTLMQPNLSIRDLRDLPVSMPPFSEQQIIVATLDSLRSKVDHLQENFKKISQECDALKQVLLRQIFE